MPMLRAAASLSISILKSFGCSKIVKFSNAVTAAAMRLSGPPVHSFLTFLGKQQLSFAVEGWMGVRFFCKNLSHSPTLDP